MIAHLLIGLRGFWNFLCQPLVTLDDEDSRHQASIQASLFLIGALLLLLIIPFTYFIGAPGTTVTSRLLSDLACVTIFVIGYVLSRYNRLQLAVVFMIFPASGLIAALSIATGQYGYFVIFFLGIPLIISGLFAAPRVTITLVIVDTVFSVFCGVIGFFSADILISPIIFNIVVALFTVGTVEYRRKQIDRYILKLSQSEARHRALVESVKDIIFTISADGKITSINAAVTTIAGWEIEDLTGRYFLEIFHPEDRDRIKDTFLKIIQGERPHRIEGRTLTKDGQYRWMELSASAINVEGLHGMSGVARDINARKLIEAALQESRQRLSLFIGQMPLALIEWDSQQKLIAWNPAASHIFGYTMEEAVRFEGFDFLVAAENQANFNALLMDVFEQKSLRLSTSENVTRDGRTIICEWVTIPLVDESGTLLGVAAMAEDVTERISSQQHQMKLMLTQERLTVLQHFLSSISHDFRTSLAQIETSRYLIERTIMPSEKDKVQYRLDNIGFSIQHLVTQLENLNMISSLGQLHLRPQNINLMLNQLVMAKQQMAAAKQIQIERAFGSDVPSITIDSDKVLTAISHILTNAITYTPDGESITITTEKRDDWVFIHVHDTGEGIDPEDQAHIFDLFYRADKARSLNTGGVGVGLSIARLIAEAHGGTLSVVSSRGQGSTFTMTLPAVPVVAAKMFA